MTLNPDPNKQKQEVIFYRKIKKTSRPQINTSSVKQVQLEQRLGVYLDGKLDFKTSSKHVLKR